ncbi:hypothetical protein MJD09_15675 [bacterium]|nr:hypothetical protein [bacterium]
MNDHSSKLVINLRPSRSLPQRQRWLVEIVELLAVKVHQFAEVLTDYPDCAFLVWRSQRLIVVWLKLAKRQLHKQDCSSPNDGGEY